MSTTSVSRVITLLAGTLASGVSALANSPPVVSNITASQRTDGSNVVDIYYNLTDADGDACTVTVQASNDGGATWTVPITALSGAVGAGITPGVDKLIIWNCATDLPGAFGTQYRINVCADDGYTPPPPGMVLIPAGEFQMGDTFNEGYSSEQPLHAVYVDTFCIDSYEVTNQQYADALNWAWSQGGLISVTNNIVYKYNSGTSYPYCATKTEGVSYSRITWDGSTFGVISGKENHPMVLVSWYGAVAYANWRSSMQGKPLCYDLSTWECNFGSGYRLPTEAEWEKAARGGAAGHRFPWSDTDTIQHARANYFSSSSPAYDTSPTSGLHPAFSGGGDPCTGPVGYFAPNGYGLYEVAGNVWEWCQDWYGDTYYDGSPYSNPHGPTGGSRRVFRGSAWGSYASTLRCAFRDHAPSSYTNHDGGFRLALRAAGRGENQERDTAEPRQVGQGREAGCGASGAFVIDNRAAGTIHAVIVGCRTVVHKPLWDATFRGDVEAATFANAIEVLPRHGRIELVQITDDNPVNRDRVVDAIQTVAGQVRPGDTFLFFETGHGSYGWAGDTNDETSLTPEDEVLVLTSDPGNGSAILTDNELTDCLRNTPQLHGAMKIVALTGCRTGGFWGGGDGDLESLQSSVALFAGAMEDQDATYWSWGDINGSVLGGNLIKAFERIPAGPFMGYLNADTNFDRSLSYAELKTYLGGVHFDVPPDAEWRILGGDFGDPAPFTYEPALDGAFGVYGDGEVTASFDAADLDRDGTVDAEDFKQFTDCLGGPSVTLEFGCNRADLDIDADVDLADFAAFQAAFTGG